MPRKKEDNKRDMRKERKREREERRERGRGKRETQRERETATETERTGREQSERESKNQREREGEGEKEAFSDEICIFTQILWLRILFLKEDFLRSCTINLCSSSSKPPPPHLFPSSSSSWPHHAYVFERERMNKLLGAFTCVHIVLAEFSLDLMNVPLGPW